MVQRDHMPTFEVHTAQRMYASVVQRGVVSQIKNYLPKKAGKLFLVTTEDVWKLHGKRVSVQFAEGELNVLFFPGGEANKRMSVVEALADQMLDARADRTSMVIGFGGGIVTDVAGFLAAIFMRGVPVLQIPTTLLAQVDAGIGGKTGVNLVGGKNLIGSFHQPLAVLIDPEILSTLPDREYRAGLFEVVKTGIIRDPQLFDLMLNRSQEVLQQTPDVVDELIAASVRVKAEVVTADEREGDLRRILNFGHTIGHAIEAETGYVRYLHGEAVGWGMLAATRLAELTGMLGPQDADLITKAIHAYGPLPSPGGLDPDHLVARTGSDKKTMQGKVHWVLPTTIGEVKIVSGIDPALVRQAVVESLQ